MADDRSLDAWRQTALLDAEFARALTASLREAGWIVALERPMADHERACLWVHMFRPGVQLAGAGAVFVETCRRAEEAGLL